MVLPRQSSEQALVGATDFRADSTSRMNRHDTFSRNHKAVLRHGIFATFAAAIMFFPWHAQAMENGMRRMSEDDLSRVSARGLYDRFFDKINRHLSNGMAVEVLGDLGALLNPLSSLLDADIDYKDVVFNPNSPWMVSDGNGSAYVRLPASIGEINIRNIRIAGSTGASFGSVTIRNINFNGTTIKITKR